MTQWTSKTLYWREAAGPPQGSPQQVDRISLTGHCVAKRRRICKERNGTREGIAKEAGGQGYLEIASKEDLSEPVIRDNLGVTNVARHR